MKERIRWPASRTLIVILLAGAVLRLGVALISCHHAGSVSIFHSSDTITYIEPARELLETGRFATGDAPQVMRTPGYPIALIPGIMLGHLEWVSIILQVMFSLITVLAVYRIAWMLTENRNLSLGAAALCAIEPTLVIYSSDLLSETLFTCLLSISVVFLVEFFQRNRAWTILAATIVLAAATYVRPITYFLPVALFLFLLACSLMQRSWRTGGLALGFLFISLALTGIWQVRNYSATGFGGFSSITSHNLYLYNAGAVLAEQQGMPIGEAVKIMSREDPCRTSESGLKMDLAARDKCLKENAVRMIGQHPGVYLKAHLKGVFRTVVGPGISHWEHRCGRMVAQIIKWPFALLQLGILSLALIGIIRFPFLRRPEVMLLLCIAFYLVFLTGPAGYCRLRHPAIPLMTIFAIRGLWCLRSFRVPVRRPGRAIKLSNVN